ncbi:48_t:CDS:2, partial [Acaulospora colombiana]
ANRLEELLDRFYLDLPEILKCDFTNGAPNELPPPHVLTLNMQYWNAVRTPQRRESPDSVNSPADSDVLRATSARALDICKRAAGHEVVFLACLSIDQNPVSYQGEESGETIRHLQQSMEALKEISVLWPSAGRAWELIKGTSRLNFADGLENPSDVSYGYPQGRSAQSSFYSTANDPSGAPRGFIQSNTSAEQSLPPWGTNDSSSVRQPFNPSISHTRSASAGSYRDYGNNTAMPHFWSDPFTDSTLLTSNYYGLPMAMDQSVGTSLDQQAGSGYGRVNYTPFDAPNF